MDLQKALAQHKTHISDFLLSYLLEKKHSLRQIKPYSSDVFTRLETFALTGKMVRGGLILVTLELFNKQITDDALRIAGAIELIHSALLIHDDIMDDDMLRRGEKTLHIAYAESFSGKQKIDTGKSLALCVGDICFFLAYDLLAQTSLPVDKKKAIQELFCDEFIKVGLMQMQDVTLSEQEHLPTTDAILSLYTYKTARYTFSLPFVAGAILAGAPHKVMRCLEQLGEHIGVIFQLKDDELSIYGTEEETGKPVGSDLRENKKTYHHVKLMMKASPQDKMFVARLQQKKSLSLTDMKKYQRLLEKYAVPQDVNTLIESLRQKSLSLLQTLPFSPEHQQFLSHLLTSTIARKK